MKTLKIAVLVLMMAVWMGVGASGALAQQTEEVEKPDLRDEILEMVEASEELRDSLDNVYGYGQPMSPADSARMDDLRQEHVDRMSEIVREHGWPGLSMVGEDGAEGAWLVAQHADGYIRFQRAVLAFMEEALDEGEIDPRHYAYLKDRVRVSQGEPQVYGTQVQFVGGQVMPHRIEDEETVDERREEKGLQPLNEYLEEVRQATQ